MPDPVLVQATTIAHNSDSRAFPAPVTAGNCIVIWASKYQGGMLATDPSGVVNGSAFAMPIHLQRAGTGDERVAIFYLTNIAGGAETITLANAGAGLTWIAAEFSGVATVSPVDDTATNSATGVATTGPLTASTASSLLLAALTHNGANDTITPGASMIEVGEEQDNNTFQSLSALYRILSAGGVVSADWTTSHTYGAVGLILTGSGGGGTTYDETISLGVRGSVTSSSAAVLVGGIALTASGEMNEGGAADLAGVIALGSRAGLSPTAIATVLGTVGLGGRAALTPSGVLVLQLSQAYAAAAALTATGEIGAATYTEVLALAARALVTPSGASVVEQLVSLAGAATITEEVQQALAGRITFELRADLDAIGQQATTGAIALGATAVQAQAAGASLQASLTLGIAALLAAAGAVSSAPVLASLGLVAVRLSAGLRVTNVRARAPLSITRVRARAGLTITQVRLRPE